MAVIGGAGLKLVGTHAGATLASDGPSQMALADVAFMRAFSHVEDKAGRPAVTVLTPSDAVGAYAMVLAMACSPGAFYLRAVRADLPILYADDERFPFGGHKVLRCSPNDGPRMVLVASGYMVHGCLEAAEVLAKAGHSVAVVDAYCLPMDTAPVLALAGRGGVVMTVEDNYVGGIGSELAEAAAEAVDAPMVHALAVRTMRRAAARPTTCSPMSVSGRPTSSPPSRRRPGMSPDAGLSPVPDGNAGAVPPPPIPTDRPTGAGPSPAPRCKA